MARACASRAAIHFACMSAAAFARPAHAGSPGAKRTSSKRAGLAPPLASSRTAISGPAVRAQSASASRNSRTLPTYSRRVPSASRCSFLNSGTALSPEAGTNATSGGTGGGNAPASGGSSIARGGATRSPPGVRRSRIPNLTGEMRPSQRTYCTTTGSFSP